MRGREVDNKIHLASACPELFFGILRNNLISEEKTVGRAEKVHLTSSFISCFCGRGRLATTIIQLLLNWSFFRQYRSGKDQTLDRSCSRYHQFSFIGCRTGGRGEGNKISATRSKMPASKLSSSPKARSSLTSSGPLVASLVSCVECSLG